MFILLIKRKSFQEKKHFQKFKKKISKISKFEKKIQNFIFVKKFSFAKNFNFRKKFPTKKKIFDFGKKMLFSLNMKRKKKKIKEVILGKQIKKIKKDHCVFCENFEVNGVNNQ